MPLSVVVYKATKEAFAQAMPMEKTIKKPLFIIWLELLLVQYGQSQGLAEEDWIDHMVKRCRRVADLINATEEL